MERWLRILSEVYSVLLYPMLMPVYGMGLFCAGIVRITPSLPKAYLWLCMCGTIVLTVVIPVLLLLYLKHKGRISSLYLDGQDERTIPYVYTLVCYGFWAYFLRGTMGLPDLMLWVSLGAIVALGIVTVVNRWWKISAHLTGMGGLLGGICSYALYYSVLPSGLMASLLLAALVLMYARIYLGAHTALQVVCGMLVGVVSTFLPSMIMSYA